MVVVVVVVGACVVLNNKNVCLRIENTKLKHTNINLNKNNEILKDIINDKSDRINCLEELCEEKDKYFKKAISDGLKKRSSFAGKQMNYRKEYLKETAMC